ncbi:hypothetical protein F0231_00750 [Vibrio sp. RE86]|uniref:hypothetical protein n=1 Tax=Vibrio sp. RE86 TaxID=2607605 RepID=UPI001493AA54|nr:hypothetical protein [Vibrio sp. RE86]NOH78263.1 hypothetical protein [Vibrio sp. RE86]
MKKTLIALTVTATFSLTAFAAPVQVDRELANSYTDQLIETQMTQIDASVLAQLNAQSSDVAVIDDVVYEKQSDGTWAAVGAASAALVAGLLSTSSSSDNSVAPELPIHGSPDHLPHEAPVNPIETEGLPSLPLPVDIDNPNVKWGMVEVQDTTYITKDGQLAFAVHGGVIFDVNSYEPVGQVHTRPDGKIYKIELNGAEVLVTNRIKNGAEMTVTRQDGSSFDVIWTQQGGIVIAGTPDRPVEGVPSLPLPIDPENPIFEGEGTGNVKVFVDMQDSGIIVFRDADGNQLGRVDRHGDVYVNGNKVGTAEYHGHKNNQITISLDNGATINYKGFNEKNKSGQIVRANGDVYNWTPKHGLVPAGGEPANPVPSNPIHDTPDWEVDERTNGSYEIYRDGVSVGNVKHDSDSENGRTNLTVVTGNQGGMVIVETDTTGNARELVGVTANEQAKETIKSIAKQPRFDKVRSQVQSRIN